MDLTVLRKIGLSEGEVKVYGALLQKGPSALNQIHEATGIERRNIYDILNKLIERGLVGYIDENRKRTYRISAPQKIISYLDEKKSVIDSNEEEVKKILPELDKIFQEKKTPISAEVFRGAEGIKAVWDDMLNYKEIRWIGSGGYIPNQFPIYFKKWDKKRAEKQIKTIHLYRYEKREQMKKLKLYDSKYLPPEFSGNPTFTAIFGNKISQFLVGENLFAFVIESKELAENYRSYHKYLYDKVAVKYN